MFKRSVKEEHLNEALLASLQLGVGVGDVHYLVKTSTAAPSLKLYDRDVDDYYIHSTLATAEAALTSARNDVILVSPEAHSLAAAVTWDLSNSHLIGLAPSGIGFAKRSRIGMSTTFTPMITVSGDGNSFTNIYTQHGTAAGDYTSWYVTGNRNVFHGCHFAGPMNAAQGGHASYIGVHVTGSENIFENCVFGSKSVARDEVTPNLKIAGGDNVFRNCLFVCALTDTDPIFVMVDNTTTVNAWFEGCKFFAFSASHANKMAVAFLVGAGDGTGQSADIVLDQNCTFAGVTKITASLTHQFIWMPTVFAATADELNLIAINSATY